MLKKKTDNWSHNVKGFICNEGPLVKFMLKTNREQQITNRNPKPLLSVAAVSHLAQLAVQPAVRAETSGTREVFSVYTASTGAFNENRLGLAG